MGAPRVAGSVAELVEGATSREVIARPDDGKSGSTFERVVIDGAPHLLKCTSHAGDWVTRMLHDTDHRPFRLWASGFFDEVPPEIDHATVGMALEGEGTDAVVAVLMRDVGEHLIPEGDATVPLRQHRWLLDGLAALSARFWGWEDDLGLTPFATRLLGFTPANIAPELGPDAPPPILAAEQGWQRLPERAPELARLVFALHDDPGPVLDVLASTPSTFLHGDWKMGNLGTHPDGRTILLDWTLPGAGPVCSELAWYLAINRARLPESKEATIGAFRGALEARGVDTGGWWSPQLDASLVGIMAMFAWEKALGDDEELAWWSATALAAADRLWG